MMTPEPVEIPGTPVTTDDVEDSGRRSASIFAGVVILVALVVAYWASTVGGAAAVG